ncbi:hypothetical protein B0T24DRAFT_669090 [Lasiosphaeria ovina]|uniref:F-box domain-containing protein n=1 Tax=Lasiosphaeria ovina TaxID=92902 RepID=A0AAE0K503_9PEZI|nr:hypothetical protein B0T24DRAFT_669090 [Lasiosphaeria ovina]
MKPVNKATMLYERLRRRWAQSSTKQPTPECDLQQGSCLAQQPVDILLEIADHLPPESQVCLALSCRAFFNFFGVEAVKRVAKQRPVHRQPARRKLLLLLEKDIGDRYLYCHRSNMLNRFTIRSPQQARLKDFRLTKACCQWEDRLYPRRQSWLRFHHVRAVTNSHWLGPGAGLPAELFTSVGNTSNSARFLGGLAHPTRLGPVFPRWVQSRSAKLIGGELILHYTWTLADCFPHERRLRRALDNVGLWICPHLYTRASPYWDHFDQRRINGVKGGDQGEIRDGNFTDSCEWCLTDSRIVIEWKPGGKWPWTRGGRVVTITSYRNLGSCREPDDKIWLASIGHSVYWTKRQALGSPLCPEGSVERAWVEACSA